MQKTEVDLTDEEKIKVGLILGRIEGMRNITVSLQDVWRKACKMQNKRKWDLQKSGEKQCTNLDFL